MQRFDVVVLGTGNAGQAAARVAREAGRSVVIVDGRAPGGTCALRGCVPKKVLVAAAEVLDTIRRAHVHGITVGPATLDWKALVDREQGILAGTTETVTRSFADRGIARLEGWARFVGRDALEVDGERVEADAFVVATGSVARALPFPGAELLRTSDDLLVDRHLPASLVFVGSGVIAFEFAHVLVRAGAAVTMLARRPLAAFDRPVVDRLVAYSERIGIRIVPADVTAVERTPGGLRVRHSAGEVVAEAVVNAAGRVPDLDRLALAEAGVACERGLPVVDERQRSTTNPSVWFAGDALPGRPQLSPVATAQGAYVGAQLVGEDPPPIDYQRIPHVVFTIPPLAAVGRTERAARDAGLDVEVKDNELTGWRSARTYAEEEAFARVVLEKETGRIVGATLLGHGGPEVIHALASAIGRGVTAPELARTVFAYPTFHADLKYLVA